MRGQTEPVDPTADPTSMVKPIDAVWTVAFVDPIAVRLVPRLARVPAISPLAITLLAHGLGVVSAVLFARGQLLVPAVLFELRFVADCLDGKLARFTGRTSALGRELDAFGDRFVVAATFAAIGWASGAEVATLVLVAAYPLSFHLLEHRRAAAAAAGVSLPHEGLATRGYGAFMRRHRCYPMPTPIEAEHLLCFVAPIAACLGGPTPSWAVVVVAAFFVLQCARYSIDLLRAAQHEDRVGGSA